MLYGLINVCEDMERLEKFNIKLDHDHMTYNSKWCFTLAQIMDSAQLYLWAGTEGDLVSWHCYLTCNTLTICVDQVIWTEPALH